MNKILKCLSVLLFTGCTFTMVACGGGSGNTGSTQTGSSATQTSQTTSKDSGGAETGSVIKSLTAKSANVGLKMDENVLITNYYTITGYSSLSAAQKTCTYTSSNESVVKISSKSMKAVGLGESVVTVTSKTDTTKSCSFTVKVTDVFFDRELSSIDGSDDFENELPTETTGGKVRTTAASSGDYVVKGVDSTKWYIRSEVTINQVAANESWPKWGIMTTTASHTSPENNGFYFFLNGEIGAGKTEWTTVGFTEVSAGSNWAWNPSVNDAMARHNDGFYDAPSAIATGTKFTMAMARDGYNFHMWFNDVYAGSVETLHDLFGDTEGPVASAPGLFQFNSDVTYENYEATGDAAKVDEKIASITEKNFITTFNVDSNE